MLTDEQIKGIRSFVSRNGAILDQAFPTQETKVALIQKLSSFALDLDFLSKEELPSLLAMMQYYIAKEVLADIDA